MSKLAIGLVAGLVVGSTLSQSFHRAVSEAASNTTRSVIGLIHSVRDGASSLLEEVAAEANRAPDAAVRAGFIPVETIGLEDSPRSVFEPVVISPVHPKPVTLDVTQVAAIKKSR